MRHRRVQSVPMVPPVWFDILADNPVLVGAHAAREVLRETGLDPCSGHPPDFSVLRDE
jgi:hypothetical protein